MPEENEVAEGQEVENQEAVDQSNEGEESQDNESSESDQDVIEKSLIDQDDEDDDEESSDDSSDKDEEGKDKSTIYEMPELGEGIEFDTELFKTMTPVLQKMKASQEDVNELVSAYANHIKTAADIHGQQLIEKYKEIKDEWVKETKTELGKNYKTTLKTTGAALKKFGSPELIELFNETGVGNHIAVIKMLNLVGQHFVEDDFAEGDGQEGDEQKAEDVLYKTM